MSATPDLSSNPLVDHTAIVEGLEAEIADFQKKAAEHVAMLRSTLCALRTGRFGEEAAAPSGVVEVVNRDEQYAIFCLLADVADAADPDFDAHLIPMSSWREFEPSLRRLIARLQVERGGHPTVAEARAALDAAERAMDDARNQHREAYRELHAAEERERVQTSAKPATPARRS